MLNCGTTEARRQQAPHPRHLLSLHFYSPPPHHLPPALYPNSWKRSKHRKGDHRWIRGRRNALTREMPNEADATTHPLTPAAPFPLSSSSLVSPKSLPLPTHPKARFLYLCNQKSSITPHFMCHFLSLPFSTLKATSPVPDSVSRYSPSFS